MVISLNMFDLLQILVVQPSDIYPSFQSFGFVFAIRMPVRVSFASEIFPPNK